MSRCIVQVRAVEDLKSCNLLKADVTPSAAQGDRSARAKVENLRGRCTNNMHAAAKLLADKDVSDGLRMVCLATDPIADDNTAISRTYKGEQGSRDFHFDRSLFGVLSSLKSVLATFRNLLALERAGIQSSFMQDCAKHCFDQRTALS
jgi:hypothetical protein